MTAQIDMGYQAELKHELKCMQKISQETKGNILIQIISERRIKATLNQFVCL